jgi:hypothetical protein
MKIQGIRIQDKKMLGKTRVVSVELKDILEEVHDDNKLYWSILFLEAIGNLGEGKSLPAFEKQIDQLEIGLLINWEDLKVLANKFQQIIDLRLIAGNNQEVLKRYENDEELYQRCDIVIEMNDSSYWEVFSKDKSFIQRLGDKFKDIVFLTSYSEE